MVLHHINSSYHRQGAGGGVHNPKNHREMAAPHAPHFTSNMSDIFVAANAGDLDGLKHAESRGGDLNWQNLYGHNSLMVASCDESTIRVLLYLLKREDVQLNVADLNGYTALHYAARGNNVEAVLALLEAGIDHEIEAKVGIGYKRTAEQLAEYCGSTASARCIASFVARYVAKPTLHINTDTIYLQSSAGVC